MGCRASGFTLIEILVVVAIIALLVAILLPSLLKAREQATGVVCGNNMHQIMLGMNTYVADSKVLPGNIDVFWTSWAEAGSPGGPLPSGTANWRPSDSWLGLPWAPKQFNQPANLADQDLLFSFVDATVPQKGGLYRYVRSEKAYLCPKDKPGFPDPNDPKGGGGNGRFSYTMMGMLGFKAPENCVSFRYVQNFTMKGGALPPPTNIIPKGTKFQWTTSKMIALLEEHPWNNTNHGWIGDSWAADSYLTFRHHATYNGGKTTFAYLDGHVESKEYQYRVQVPGTFPVQYSTFQGVDLLNQNRFPYDYAGNAGGRENVAAFVHHFPYPYK